VKLIFRLGENLPPSIRHDILLLRIDGMQPFSIEIPVAVAYPATGISFFGGVHNGDKT